MLCRDLTLECVIHAKKSVTVPGTACTGPSPQAQPFVRRRALGTYRPECRRAPTATFRPEMAFRSKAACRPALRRRGNPASAGSASSETISTPSLLRRRPVRGSRPARTWSATQTAHWHAEWHSGGPDRPSGQ